MKPVGTHLSRGAASIPPGVTTISSDAGFTVWHVSYGAARERLLDDPAALAEKIARPAGSGVAVDLDGLGAPLPDRTAAVLMFVDELQLRGSSVILHGAPADFVTALAFESADVRVATRSELSSAVATLREFDALRKRCTSDRGSRVNQLRMPARALSLAPLCAYARARLARGDVPAAVALGLLRECYWALAEILANGYEPGDGDFSISVTVHDGRATITVLDGGRPRPEPPGVLRTDRVDRVHRFRILDRHNAVVLEKELGAVTSH